MTVRSQSIPALIAVPLVMATIEQTTAPLTMAPIVGASNPSGPRPCSDSFKPDGKSMFRVNMSSGQQVHPLVLGGRQGLVLGLTLLWIAGAGYSLLLAIEDANPRRASLKRHWGSIAEGTHEKSITETIGPPDDERAVHEFIPACTSTCNAIANAPPQAPCLEFQTCVRELTWYVTPSERSGDVYVVCLDADGIARNVSHGMSFNIHY